MAKAYEKAKERSKKKVKVVKVEKNAAKKRESAKDKAAQRMIDKARGKSE